MAQWQTEPREFLSGLFWDAVKAARPENVLAQYLPGQPKGRTIVIGAGKASAQMGKAFEEAWKGPIEGLIVTQYGAGVLCDHIEIVEARHPVPDAAGLDAAQRILKLVEGLSADDLVVALISGGGSSLLPAPLGGLTLADEQTINESLLACGAPIGAMNVVRKMFSQIKGGRLAKAAFPARVESLIISDVPGDDPATVASGPTVADPSGVEEARAIVERYKIDLPPAAQEILAAGDDLPPHPDDPKLQSARHRVIASANISLRAAMERAKAAGLEIEYLGADLEGEARELGAAHARLANERLEKSGSAQPLLILSGGETTVTLKQKGRGGRNSEYLAGFALELGEEARVVALAADTDGRDGSEQNAGVFADGQTLSKVRARGEDPAHMLEIHESYGLFELANDVFETGPTGTNVNDFRAILILP